MFVYSYVVTPAVSDAKTMAWCKKITDLGSRASGLTWNLRARIGGPLGILWTMECNSLDELLGAMQKIDGDAAYQAALAEAGAENLFIPGSALTTIWVQP
jgi:hypothetical protein